MADERLRAHFKRRPSERWFKETDALKPLCVPPMYGEMHLPRKVDKNGRIRVENRYYRVPDAYRNRIVELLVCKNSMVVRCELKSFFKLDKAKDVYTRREPPASSKSPEDAFDKQRELCRKNEEWNRFQSSLNKLKRSSEAYDVVFLDVPNEHA